MILPSQSLHTFDNGLRLLVDPMPGLKTFALTALIHGGARFESEAQSGWAHLLEHMVFKGAGGRNARELAEAIELRGGSINASTGYEHTRFEVRGMTSLLPLALQIVSDLMFRSTLDRDEMEREKKVVAQEILEAYDAPDDYVFDLLQAAMFAGQSLGRPILGTKASLKPARSESLRDFSRRMYAPGRIVVCVSGGVTEAEVVDAASACMGDVSTLEQVEKPEVMRFTQMHESQFRRVEQTHVALAWRGVGRLDADIIPLRLFSEILGGGMASRLFQEAREARGLAYSIDAWSTPYRDGGVFGVYAGCAPKDAAPLIGLIRDTMACLAADPREIELERAKAQFTTSLFLNHESAASRSGTFASQMSTFGKVFTLDEVSTEINRVTRDDLVRMGKMITRQSACASAILGPRATGDLSGLLAA